MKNLYLVRHAKSSWGIDGLPDVDRHLNERGYADAHDMAARMKKIVKHPLLLSSPAIRAISTALIFGRHLGVDPSQIQMHPLLYGSSREHYCAAVAGLPDEHTTVLLFGHNPIITDAANLLAGTAVEEMSTCGIAGIEFEEKTWKKAAASVGKLVLFDFPKNKTT